MACFVSNLQLASLVVHETKIHDVVYDDIRAKTIRNDIDAYLSPLIEDLRKLWDKRVDVFDRNQNETFKLRAMIFCIINEFSTYENLSGYNVKGHHACPIYEEDTSYVLVNLKIEIILDKSEVVYNTFRLNQISGFNQNCSIG